MIIRKLGLGGASIVLLAGLALATPSFAQSPSDTQAATPHRHHHHALSNSARENARENRITAQLNDQQLSQDRQAMAQNASWSSSENGTANANGEVGPTYGSMSRNETVAPAGSPGTDQRPGANNGANGNPPGPQN